MAIWRFGALPRLACAGIGGDSEGNDTGDHAGDVESGGGFGGGGGYGGNDNDFSGPVDRGWSGPNEYGGYSGWGRDTTGYGDMSDLTATNVNAVTNKRMGFWETRAYEEGKTIAQVQEEARARDKTIEDAARNAYQYTKWGAQLGALAGPIGSLLGAGLGYAIDSYRAGMFGNFAGLNFDFSGVPGEFDEYYSHGGEGVPTVVTDPVAAPGKAARGPTAAKSYSVWSGPSPGDIRRERAAVDQRIADMAAQMARQKDAELAALQKQKEAEVRTELASRYNRQDTIVTGGGGVSSAPVLGKPALLGSFMPVPGSKTSGMGGSLLL